MLSANLLQQNVKYILHFAKWYDIVNSSNKGMRDLGSYEGGKALCLKLNPQNGGKICLRENKK